MGWRKYSQVIALKYKKVMGTNCVAILLLRGGRLYQDVGCYDSNHLLFGLDATSYTWQHFHMEFGRGIFFYFTLLLLNMALMRAGNAGGRPILFIMTTTSFMFKQRTLSNEPPKLHVKG